MLFNKKRNEYRTRKQLKRNEKIKIAIVSIFFILMCAATGVTCALVAITANNNGDTEGFSSNSSYLTIDDIKPIEWGVKSERSEEVESNTIVTKINDKVVVLSTLPENSSLNYELSGTLPIGLNFNESTGEIYGTPTQITPESEPFHITGYYYPDLEHTNCIIGKSNDFTISIYGLMINNTINDVVYYMEDENDLSTDEPQMTFKGDIVPNSAITWSLDDSNEILNNLEFKDGQIKGKPGMASAVSLRYRLKAEYQGYTTFSNQFKLTVIYDPRNIFTVSGVTNLEKHYLDGHARERDENNTWMEPKIINNDDPSAQDYTISYELSKNLPKGIKMEESTGIFYGQFQEENFNENYVLTVKFTSDLSSFEFLIFFNIKIVPIELDLTYTGECETEINGELFNIAFKTVFNGEELDNDKYDISFEESNIPDGLVFDNNDKTLQGMPEMDIFSLEDKTFNDIKFKAIYTHNGQEIESNEIQINLTLKHAFSLEYRDASSNSNSSNYVSALNAYIPLLKTEPKSSTLFFLDPTVWGMNQVQLRFTPVLLLNNIDISSGFFDDAGVLQTPTFNCKLYSNSNELKDKTTTDSTEDYTNCYAFLDGNDISLTTKDKINLIPPQNRDKIKCSASLTYGAEEPITSDFTINIKIINKLNYQLKSNIEGNPILNSGLIKGTTTKEETWGDILTNYQSEFYRDKFSLDESKLTSGITFDLSMIDESGSEVKLNRNTQRIKILKQNNNSHFTFSASTLKLFFSPYSDGNGSQTILDIYYEEYEDGMWKTVSVAFINIVW